jgi:hypothetical protein
METIPMRKLPGMYWHNHCDHKPGEYVGSIEFYSTPHELNFYDIYIFNHERLGQEVCIRYGDEGCEYISPGRLCDFYTTSRMLPNYQVVVEFLNEKGQLKWERKTALT